MLPLFILAIEDPQTRETFAELYRLYEEFMYQTAFSVLKNSSDAEDAVHQVFLRLLENGAEPDPADARIKAYLGIAVKNAAFNLRRKTDRTVSLDETLNEASDTGFEPRLDPASESYELQQAVSQLPGAYKEAITLYYYEGYHIKEIAKITGQKPSAVQKHLERARQMLKARLEEDEK